MEQQCLQIIRAVQAAVVTPSMSSVPAHQSCHHRRTVAPPSTLLPYHDLLGPIRTMLHLALVSSRCVDNNYSAAVGERSIAISLSVYVSVCVCLSVCEHISGTTIPIFTNLLCRSPVAMAWSCSGGVAIRYVIPVYG